MYIYVNKLSELLLEQGKQLEVIAYQSLYDAVHSMKQTLEKCLLVDFAVIREMVERNEVHITWIKKEKQLRDILTKSKVSSKIFKTG